MFRKTTHKVEKFKKNNYVRKFIFILFICVFLVSGFYGTPAVNAQTADGVLFASGNTNIENSNNYGMVAISKDDGSKFWDFDPGQMHGIALGGDFEQVYYYESTPTVHALEAKENKNSLWSNTLEYSAKAIYADSSGNWVYASAGSGTGDIWKLHASNGSVEWRTQVNSRFSHMETTHNNNYLIGTRGDFIIGPTSEITVVDTSTGNVEATKQISGSDRPRSHAYHTKKDIYYVQTRNGTVVSYNVSNNQVQWTYSSSKGGMDVSLNGSHLYIGHGSVIEVIDTESGSKIKDYSTTKSDITEVRVDRFSDEYIYIGDGGGNVAKYNKYENNIVWQNNYLSNPIYDIETGSQFPIPEPKANESLDIYANEKMAPGTSQGYTITYTNPDNNPIDVTDSATVTSSNSSIISVNTSSNKFESGSQTGSVTITATYQNSDGATLSDSMDITVEYGDKQGLIIDSVEFMYPDSKIRYKLIYIDENTNLHDVSRHNSASITSNNTSALTIDRGNLTFNSAKGVATKVTVEAQYEVDNITFNAEKDIAVANVTIENINILPSHRKFEATITDLTTQVIFAAIFIALFVTRFLKDNGKSPNNWISLGSAFSVILLAGIQGWVTNGIVFSALFFVILASLILGNVRRNEVSVVNQGGIDE